MEPKICVGANGVRPSKDLNPHVFIDPEPDPDLDRAGAKAEARVGESLLRPGHFPDLNGAHEH